jgi:DNA-binding LacI/PurR family transcriptional regulator
VVTVYDVASAAGVSIASVSRALNGQPGVGRATVEKIQRVATELGWSPNDIARSLSEKTTRTIALVLPDITNPFFPELVKGVQTAADERHNTLLLANSGEDAEKFLRDLEALRRKQVDGVILISDHPDQTRVAEICAGIPVVALDRDLGDPGASVVGVDHEEGARKAVAHLIELGHRRIAHIAGPAAIEVSARRRAGWAQALEEAGLAARSELVVSGTFLEEGGFEAGLQILDRLDEFTAVFAANDLTAVGFLAACASRGVQVPHEVSLVGFDGIHLTRYTTPTLTTVAQPIFDLGHRAGELLFEAISTEDPVKVKEILPTRLVVGASSAAPRRSA